MSQEKENYHLFGTVQEFKDSPIVCKQIGTKRVAVSQIEGVWYAFEDTCPHQGESLSKGTLKGCIITCPAHNWKFDLKSGESTVIPDEFIYTFDVKVEAEKIFVNLKF
ncbi:MAG: Rieske 2Fe-2S domain-containing protein [Bdellovibrionales bacterium]|nr:Rieske 2Fe-2S domain-containing protein [Bdellovibrionales bacterium]